MLRLDKKILQNFSQEENDIIVSFHKLLYQNRLDNTKVNVDHLIVILDYLTLLDNPEGNLLALKMVDKGLKQAPNDTDLLQLKARIQLLFFQPKEALELAQSLTSDENPESYILLAQIYTQQRTEEGDNKVKEAIKKYTQLEPNDHNAILDIINYRADKINYTLYLSLLQQVAANGHDFERALNSIALCMLHFNSETTLIYDMKTVLSTLLHHKPFHLKALVYYAELMAMENNYHQAADIALTYCSLHEAEPNTQIPLLLDAAEYLVLSQQYDAALETLKKFEQLCPTHNNITHYDTTRPLLDNFNYLNPEKHSYDYLKGMCYIAKENYQEALPHLTAVINRHDVEVVAAMRALSIIAFELGEQEKAGEYALSAVSLSTGSLIETARSLQNLGEIYFRMASTTPSKEFKKMHINAAKLAYNSAEGHYHLIDSVVGLAKVSIVNNELEEANEWLNSALKEDPQNINALEVKTALLIVNKAFDKAEATYRMLVELSPYTHSAITRIVPEASNFLTNISF
ncbi:MAG: tetratricopeptide repeat protein [Bacteroidales bacterium]|nr:tetratricopeptide repeat protein [Bacteroidales bacterium]